MGNSEQCVVGLELADNCWLARFNVGYTGRANAVMPLHCGRMVLDRKISCVEEVYRYAGLLDWALQQGAHSAYLQVTSRNEAANRLYRKLGFSEKARYTYLKKELDHG